MEKIGLKVGTKIELELVDKKEQKIGQTYISQVLDILEYGSLVIAAPIHEARLTFILPGTLIRIIFLDEADGLLSLTATITSKSKSGNVTAFCVKPTGAYKKIQRRQYFRFDCNLPVRYLVCDESVNHEDIYANLEMASKNAVTRDISGCGACIVTQEDLPKNSLIALEILLPTGIKLNSICKVIRSQRIETAKDKRFQVGLYFNKISHKDQDILVKYVFDQERLLLKKTSWRKD